MIFNHLAFICPPVTALKKGYISLVVIYRFFSGLLDIMNRKLISSIRFENAASHKSQEPAGPTMRRIIFSDFFLTMR